MAYNNDVTILVQSCDQNEDLWPVFFEVFFRQWPECPYNVILNTETKQFHCKEHIISTINLDCDVSDALSVPWSDRYIHVLNQINTKYVLVFLDDFFPRESISTFAFNSLINKVDQIVNFGCVYFNFPNKPVFYDKKLDLFFIHKDTWSRVNSVCGLWKSNELVKTLVPGESPWEYEPKATLRYKHSKTKFYATNYDTSPIKLLFCEQLVRGKWSCECVKLLKKMDIEVDYEKRGIVEFPYKKNRILRYKPENLYLRIRHSIYIYNLFKPIRYFRKIKKTRI